MISVYIFLKTRAFYIDKILISSTTLHFTYKDFVVRDSYFLDNLEPNSILVATNHLNLNFQYSKE